MSDLYRALGVNRTASTNEIKSAYRRLARQYHPDVNASPSAASEFARITEAYHTLSDTQKRAHYDRTGTNLSSSGSRRAATAAASARRAYYQARADRIVNEWLEREREETKWRGQAVYTTVALFLSTFMVAMIKPSIFEPLPGLGKFVLVALSVIGIWHLGRNLKRQMDHYTYRPVMISLMRYNKPAKPFSRSAAWAFIAGGYLVSFGMGLLMGLLADFNSKREESVLFGVLFYPPIVVLIVDMMYLVNQRFDEW
jgi:DnaJ domain